MGGYGSGWQGRAKTTVEAALVLSSTALMRQAYFRADTRWKTTWGWTSIDTGKTMSSIGFDGDLGDKSGTVRLYYSQTNTGESLDYQINVTTTAQRPWGGLRWWFVCPLIVNDQPCGRRVGKLYLPPVARYFGCRKCHDLTYTSCQKSHEYDGLFAQLAADTGLSADVVKRTLRRMGC